jgi:NitT/TauT family transport system substrate-binding protein
VDVVGGSLLQNLSLAAEGRNVRSFLLLYTRSTIVIAVAPAMAGKVTDIAKLKKHTVGVSTLGSPLHMSLKVALIKQGLSPDDDVSIVPVGTAASSLTALKYGKVDAAVLVGSAITTFELQNPHAVFLLDTRTPEGLRKAFGYDVFPSTSIVAQDSWLTANPDTARRFAKAVLKAMEWMRTHSAEEVRAKMPEETRMPDAEADLQAIRQAQQTLSPDGVFPDSAPELMREFLAVSNERVRKANIDFTKIYTNEFVINR